MDIKPFLSLSQKIDFYLDGYLDKEELEKFEESLKNDPELAFELERVRIARVMIKNEKLRDKITTIQSEEIIERRKNAKRKNFISILILGLFIFLFFTLIIKVITINNDNLFKEGYLPYRLSVSEVENTNDFILYNFNKLNYQDVIHNYENTPQNSNRADFLAGIAYLEINLPDSSIGTLRKIVDRVEKGGDNLYFKDVEYYLGFAYLKANAIGAAYWYFSKIYNDVDHPYHDKLNGWFFWKVRLLLYRKKFF